MFCPQTEVDVVLYYNNPGAKSNKIIYPSFRLFYFLEERSVTWILPLHLARSLHAMLSFSVSVHPSVCSAPSLLLLSSATTSLYFSIHNSSDTLTCFFSPDHRSLVFPCIARDTGYPDHCSWWISSSLGFQLRHSRSIRIIFFLFPS